MQAPSKISITDSIVQCSNQKKHALYRLAHERRRVTWQVDERQVFSAIAQRLRDVVPATVAPTAMLL